LLLVLDDSASFTGDRVFIDPGLLVAHLQEFLITTGLRREASLVVQSGAIRNLHDLMFVLGLGADAVHPYLLWRVSAGFVDDGLAGPRVIEHTFSVLQKGMEKVMSTMGIHEICGYGRIFSAIGLRSDLAAIMRLPNFCASDTAGLGLASLEEMGARRQARAAAADAAAAVYREPERNPRVGRIIRNAALAKTGYVEMATELGQVAEEMPTGIRHLLRVTEAPPSRRPTPDEVDISVGNHAMPLVIAAMSFGSQGESSFRTYAEAALKANIIGMNGEGGEIPDMLGRYRQNRGQQIASGRFGVFIDFLNSADYLEIKIGQGAKPGEGGHLPGSKVSDMVAAARHCKPGITLISPSNHHDIYSIEDLAQIITELKIASPGARVSVKIPVTGGVGTIAVGIAKAGADIVNISGYEGGTGAAREHAKRFVGLPVEIGVSEAHRALVESGLRAGIEIWADGGLRSGDDVLKMILLGANRAGLGTAAIMAIGCISCRQCHLDRCPRGISTRLQTMEEAIARGLKGFVPRVVEEEAENLARLLKAIGDELRLRTAALGEARLQNLVGRTDLLRQYRLRDRLDVADILRRPGAADETGRHAGSQIIRKPLSYLTRLISDLAMERFGQGEKVVHFAEEEVRSTDRAVGTYLAGALARSDDSGPRHKAVLRLGSSVPGNGLCAFGSAGVEVIVEGGSQDGAAKGSMGGLLGVFKGQNLLGRHLDGSTGKSFAYGAIGGLFMVQNMADSRACVRMSGADVVFGGRITGPVHDELGNLASRAHLKGFAFEYMTGAVVLGDPGPWICAGMTGGVIYQCLYPEYGFVRESLARRLSRSAGVTISHVNKAGIDDLHELLGRYIVELEKTFQLEEARAVSGILREAADRFLMIRPRALRPVSAE
ncbi:MAG: glutamate synthase, partial [Deltaproteobacteria bacterium]|nr:glutamate synthase [Deltaproteobacteria bacterium]